MSINIEVDSGDSNDYFSEEPEFKVLSTCLENAIAETCHQIRLESRVCSLDFVHLKAKVIGSAEGLDVSLDDLIPSCYLAGVKSIELEVDHDDLIWPFELFPAPRQGNHCLEK